ncbi:MULTISPECIES: dTDP-4-dehydrorhamnose reductase [unclassified Flavobacterium]|uniref:dTDP-4-dehydrorhamnose reductase n=1 Tax=unclassified Flavobacterium TaxID=196869 RepID=UPI00086E5D0C|nr:MULTISPECIES: dTDP-4-dehydrorhamnose reductase [unclassified Flavobacterium]MBN9285359.1 dTDP-4-dehydrorhamnose reductase [Flavobacterium sp.]ODS84577.1 MAG: dTDP-4-dehydrorhamnose reductase [Chryseobacterium sp. SCN 40-13]OJV71640.1 MAG: dTDP-4-dehydrorhamnose reductase [Flavobacterium sp. 40-81]
MVVLVTGAAGQLGQSIQAIAKNYPEITFFFATSAEIDITNKENITDFFLKVKPDYCINAAAYTAVDKAESEPEKAYSINVTGAQYLAEVCKDFDTVLLHISTDFVFDGNKSIPYTEEDQPNPTGVYGQTKLEGEQVIQQIAEKYYIIRTSWVYSEFGNNFMKTMLRLASERDTLNVVNDQIGTPTYAVDLAKALLQIITSAKENYGIYNFSNEGVCSWFDFAKKIFEVNHVTIELNPIPTSAYPTPAKRPKYSVLDKSKIKSIFGVSISKWDEKLGENVC